MVLDIVIAILLFVYALVALEPPARQVMTLILAILMVVWVIMALSSMGPLRLRS